MSRVGKSPISIPSQVTVEAASGSVIVRGPKGTLTVPVPHGLTVAVDGRTAVVDMTDAGARNTAIHGLVRANIANAVKGVTDGFSKVLELVGVGYRANIEGRDLVLHLGLSHTISFKAPEGITFEVKEGRIVVSGTDKYLVGQTAADLRALKKPEPYKGKGIRYAGEHIRKKAGKAKAVAGATAK